MSKDSRHRVPGPSGSSFTRVLAAAALALAAVSSSAHAAAWLPAGIPLRQSAGAQSGVRAVTDGRGGFLAAWVDTISGTPAILAQRVDSTGALQWGSNGVTVNQFFPGASELAIAPDGANGLLLAWVVDRGVAKKNVCVQRLGSGGGNVWPSNGIFVDVAAGDTLQGAPRLDSDGSGGAIVAWVDGRNGSDDDVYVQRIASDSSRAWTAGGVLVDTDADDQANPRVLGDGAGGAWVSWEDVASPTRTFFQRFDPSGAELWTAGGVTPTSASDPSEHAFMARVPGGDSLMIVWSETTPDQIQGTLQRRDGSFVTAGGNQLRSTSMLPMGLVPQAGGTSLLVYASASLIEGIALTALVNDTGSPATIASGQTLTATSNITAVPDGAGGAFVVWASAGSAFARHLSATATADWAGPVALTSVTPLQTFPVAVPGYDLMAAWVDGRNGGTGPDLYMQRVSPSGVTGSYVRILATNGGGSGTFTQNGGRTWVREGDSLRVRFTGSVGSHVDHTVVGTTNLGPVPNYTFHTVAGDSTLQAFFSSAPIVTQVAAVDRSYRAFSVPATLAPNTVATLFSNLMPYDPTRWRLGHFEADDSMYLQPGTTPSLDNIVPGAGYWFVTTKDTTLTFSGAAVSETQFNLAMLGGPVSGRGWTQFGSPFRHPVAVSQLRLSLLPGAPITDAGNTFTDAQVYEWNPGTSSFVTVSVLLPGHAYWLYRLSASAVTLQFPFEWNPVATGGLTPSLATLGDWSVEAVARAGAREARLVFGAGPVVAGRSNRLSAHALPDGPESQLSMVARVSDWGDDNGDYATVFRPDAETLRWEFDATAPAGLTEAALAFTFTDLPANRRVVISEPATGWSREVAAGESVPLVMSANPRRLRLEVLANSPVTPSAPLATMLRGAGPNPFRDSATLSFSLARGGPLRWDVYDLGGRRVVSGTRTLDAGEHVVTWDGRDDSGRRVEPGLYLLRWQADGRSGTARLVRTQ